MIINSSTKKKDLFVMLLIICGVVLTTIGLLLVSAAIWNFVVESSPDNQTFSKGTLPTQPLDGPYKGTWNSVSSWAGKEFDAKNDSGINFIDKTKKFQFTTLQAKSLHSNKEVLKLNYSNPYNPLWLRFITDEIVQVEPGQYQGKVYVQFLPGLAVTITYFKLEK